MFDDLKTDRVRRWRLIVEEYGPTITYIPGIKNVVADTLSRHPRVAHKAEVLSNEPVLTAHPTDDDDTFPLATDVIAAAQQKDDSLQRLVKSGQLSTIIVNRIVLVVHNNKIVVPTSLQKRLIQWYHNNLLHPGIRRTIKTIQQNFWWQNMTKHIEDFILKCPTCQHKKKSTKKYDLLPTKTHNPQPCHTVCVDLADPWSFPSDNNISLLLFTMMDPDTAFIEMQAIPNKRSSFIAETFDRIWLCRYPRPTACIFDAGTEFTGFEFQEMLQS
jgi:Integrase zinc binding domain